MRYFGIAVVFGLAVAAVFALGAAITMLWLGAVYGLFGLLAPLGFWESLGLFVLTNLLVNTISPTIPQTTKSGE